MLKVGGLGLEKSFSLFNLKEQIMVKMEVIFQHSVFSNLIKSYFEGILAISKPFDSNQISVINPKTDKYALEHVNSWLTGHIKENMSK